MTVVSLIYLNELALHQRLGTDTEYISSTDR